MATATRDGLRPRICKIIFVSFSLIMYSEALQKVGKADATKFPHHSQPLRAKKVKPNSPDSFVARLKKVLGVTTNVEVAAKLEVSPSTVSDYAGGRTHPPAAKLIAIAEKSHVSLDWLLLGKGEEPASIVEFLAPEVRSTVEALAAIEDRDVEEVIADLVSDALEERAAEMIRNRRMLRPTEMRKVKVLMKLLEIEDEAAEVIRPARKKAR